jgi:hypothetical protein
MTSIPNYLSEVYSEESYSFTEAEYDEVMSEPAVIGEDWAGYEDWSVALEQQKQWEGSKEINGILIKKACEHKDCPHERCEKETRIDGIMI